MSSVRVRSCKPGEAGNSILMQWESAVRIVVCKECEKPFRCHEESGDTSLPVELEEVPCPYGGHVAGALPSSGWWLSAAMRPDEQQAWLKGDSNA